MSQDIRKWFMKQNEKGAGNGNTSKQAKPSEKPPAVSQPGKLLQGVQECSGRRKTSKYFAKDGQSTKDEMEVEKPSSKKKVCSGRRKTSKYFAKDGQSTKDEMEMEVEEPSAKKKAQKDSMELASNVKPQPGKKTRKLESDDEDEDFVTPTSRKTSVDTTPNKKLKSSSGKGVAKKIVDDIDEDDYQKLKSSARSAGSGRGRGAKGSSVTPIKTESMDADESDREDMDDKDAKSVKPGDESDREDMDDKDAKSVKPGGRGQGGRGAPAGGRGCGGRGGFMNFGERKVAPQKSEKNTGQTDTKGMAIPTSSKPKNQPTSQSWLPWTEKYRPKVPNDIVGNQSLVKLIGS